MYRYQPLKSPINSSYHLSFRFNDRSQILSRERENMYFGLLLDDTNNRRNWKFVGCSRCKPDIILGYEHLSTANEESRRRGPMNHTLVNPYSFSLSPPLLSPPLPVLLPIIRHLETPPDALFVFRVFVFLRVFSFQLSSLFLRVCLSSPSVHPVQPDTS